ncbi:hypothetical protein [Achromobacter xylosoxidans]|uniref:hypothetical protein n=1 Tax=Alcaligenes xylosoxydans xylosoxydans TaxID=85698 RepID=UPI001F0D4FC0|nr:hypothetical protein [Achromobacter xylosoxidans]MCH4576206.1 hypothetical protein [Achromobacter xylosoxidans]
MTNSYDVAHGLSQDEPGPLEPVEISHQPGAAPATGNTARDQEMYAAGIRTGEENAKNNAAIRAAADWLPIESAPKDGTEFQAWLHVGLWEPRCRFNPASEALEIWGRVDYDRDDWDASGHLTATHWMPLPASPGASTVEKQRPARDWELTCHECDGSGHVYVKHQVAERKTDIQEFKQECECCEGRGFVFAFQDIPGIEEYVKACRPAPAGPGVSTVEQDERQAFEAWFARRGVWPALCFEEVFIAGWNALAAHAPAAGDALELKRKTDLVAELSKIIHNMTVAQQAAWIEWQHGAGAEAGMQWIENGLAGPGQIPDADEPYGTEAQAYFDANQADPLPVCHCGRPSNILHMGNGYCSDEHYRAAIAAQLKGRE